jgi:capsular polysaccharide biosynthesis protein
MKRAARNPLSVKLAKPIARLGCAFFDPLSLFRWTGVMPHRSVSFASFAVRSHPPPPRFDAPPPPSVQPDVDWTASSSDSVPLSHLVEIEDAMVSHNGCVFDARGRYVRGASHKFGESARFWQRLERRGYVARPHRIAPLIERRSEPVVALTSSTQAYYFHWLFDVLPRLGMLEQFGYAKERIYLQRRFGFQRESLALLGIEDRRIVDCGESSILSAPLVIVPCHQIMNGRVFPDWALRFLRDRLLPAAQGEAAPIGRRLYLSRAGAAHRRIANEREVLDLLEGYGFREVRPEDLSLAQQIRHFRDAEAVVAPHGGGLANLVFCSPSCRVIELFPAANIDIYYRLSRAMDLDYHYVVAAGGDAKTLGLEDYRVPPDALKRALEAAGLARADASGVGR